jgi:hypothetical protein
MLRSITALILIVSVLTGNFSRLFIYAGFGLNQNYIALKLCENRDKPVLKCQGKCYLTKKLKQEEKKEAGSQNSGKHDFQEALAAQSYKLTHPEKPIRQLAATELSFILSTHSSLIFHPPKV